MVLSLFLLLQLFCAASAQSSVSALVSTTPYRIGSVAITQLSGVRTFTAIFQQAFSASSSVLAVSLGVSNLEYQNTGSGNLFSYKVNPYLYNSSSLSRFQFQVSVEVSTFYQSIKVSYFVTIANDPWVFTFYLADNNFTVNTSSGSNFIQQQDMVPESTRISNSASASASDPLLGGLGQFLGSTVNALLGVTTTGIGEAVMGSSTKYNAYTTLRNIPIINSLRFTYSEKWFVQVSTISNNITSMKLNLTQSNTISNLTYNCSIIVVNVSQPAAPNYRLEYLTDTENDNSGSHSIAQTEDRSSEYWLVGVSTIGPTIKTQVSFTFEKTSSALLSFSSLQPYSIYVFQVFGFAMTTCTAPGHGNMLFKDQLCYNVCPSGYVVNSSSFCVSCTWPCDTCSSTRTYCLTCDPSLGQVAIAGVCQSCPAGTFYQASSTSCQNCPSGCTACQSATNCTSCNATMQLVLAGTACVSCGASTFYQASSTSCQNCPPGCTACTSLANCSSCNSTNKYYLDSWSCRVCNSPGKFFDASSSLCSSCSAGCLTCSSATVCSQCDSALKLVLSALSSCDSCPAGTYYDSAACPACPPECPSCDSAVACTSCDTALQLVGGSCVGCASGEYFDNDTLQCSGTCDSPEEIVTAASRCEIPYLQSVTVEEVLNTLKICSSFNVSSPGETQAIADDYAVSLYLGNRLAEYHNLSVDSANNRICLQYSFSASFTNWPLQLVYTAAANTSRILNPTFSTIITGSFLPPDQKQLLSIIDIVIKSVTQNSGTVFSTVVVTSSLSFFISLIEFAEITSMYIYAHAPIPFNLRIFLSNIIAAQGCPLLPFSMPNVLDDNTLDVEEDEVFSNYDMDLYFARGNISSLFETFFIIGINFLLSISISWVPFKNRVVKFLKKRYVGRVYSNCIMCLQALQLNFVFSAAAAATSKHFNGLQHALNYGTSMVFMVIFFSIPLMSISLLQQYKNNPQVDTNDIYPGIERERKRSEIYAFVRILGLLCIAVTIPLFHYLVTVSVAIIFSCSQVYLIFTGNLFKFRVVKWLRVLHTLSFTAFNLIYVVYFIMDRCYPDLDVDVKMAVGLVSIICLLIVFIIDLLEALIDIVDNFIEKVRYVCCKKSQTQPSEPQNPGIVEEIVPFSTATNMLKNYSDPNPKALNRVRALKKKTLGQLLQIRVVKKQQNLTVTFKDQSKEELEKVVKFRKTEESLPIHVEKVLKFKPKQTHRSLSLNKMGVTTRNRQKQRQILLIPDSPSTTQQR